MTSSPMMMGPTSIHFGAAEELALTELRQRGCSRALVLSTRSVRDVADRIVERAGGRGEAWTEVAQHVPVGLAERATRAAVEISADLLVAVGGGSTIGLAKAVAVSTQLPIVAVPTTFSGSELTDIFGSTRNGRKVVGRDRLARPVAAIYDAALFERMPADMAWASALNAAAHCLAALLWPVPSPVTEALAVRGLQLILSGIDTPSAPEPAIDHAVLHRAAPLAGLALAYSRMRIHHRTCHVLGGRLGLDHARTHATLLPYSLAAELPDPTPPDASGSRGLDVVASAELPARLLEITRRHGQPTALALPAAAGADVVTVAAEVDCSGLAGWTADRVELMLRNAVSGELGTG